MRRDGRDGSWSRDRRRNRPASLPVRSTPAVWRAPCPQRVAASVAPPVHEASSANDRVDAPRGSSCSRRDHTPLRLMSPARRAHRRSGCQQGTQNSVGHQSEHSRRPSGLSRLRRLRRLTPGDRCRSSLVVRPHGAYGLSGPHLLALLGSPPRPLAVLLFAWVLRAPYRSDFRQPALVGPR